MLKTVKRQLIVLAVVVIAFDTLISIAVLWAYLALCHAGLTIGPTLQRIRTLLSDAS